jgi:hypothetical protein
MVALWKSNALVFQNILLLERGLPTSYHQGLRLTQIREFAGDYFSIGLAFYSFEDIRHALSECKHLDESSFIDDKCVRDAYLLQTHLPNTAQLIQQYGFATFSYKFHYFLS